MYIAFVRKSNFTSFRLEKSHLTIVIKINKGSLIDPKNIARHVYNIGGYGYYEIKLTDITNLNYIMNLIKQAYDKN